MRTWLTTSRAAVRLVPDTLSPWLLGEILHTDPRIIRGDTEVGRIPPDWKRFPDAVRPIDKMV